MNVFEKEKDVGSFQNLEPIEGLFVIIADFIDIRDLCFPRLVQVYSDFIGGFCEILRSFGAYVWETKTSWTTLTRCISSVAYGPGSNQS